jgi:hypothetical protein
MENNNGRVTEMNCPNCDSQIDIEWGKCQICGFPLHGSNPSPEKWRVFYKRPEELIWRYWDFTKREVAEAMKKRWESMGFEARIMYLRPKKPSPSRRRAMLWEEVMGELFEQGSSHSPNPELKVAYPIPALPVETYPIEEQKYIAGLISGEGSFFPDISRTNMIHNEALPTTERLYRYNYIYPTFTFGMNEYPEVAKAFGEYIPPKPRPYTPRYEYRTRYAKVTAIALWGIRLWTRDTRIWKEAHDIIALFGERTRLDVTPEIAREIVRQPRGKKLEYMRELKKIGLIT